MLRELLQQHNIIVSASSSSEIWSDILAKYRRSIVVKEDKFNVVVQARAGKLTLSANTGDEQLTWVCDCNSNGIVKAEVETRSGEKLPVVVFLLGADNVKSGEERVLDRFVDACKRRKYGHVIASEIVPVTITIEAEGSRKKIVVNVNPFQVPKLVKWVRKIAREHDAGNL